MNTKEKQIEDVPDTNVAKWISVGERLPEPYTSVIVVDEDWFVGEAEYDGDRFVWVSDEKIASATHWIPLPKAPKMKGGE